MYCGLGRTDHNNPKEVVPVAVWVAKPSQNYEVAPVQKFLIATGNSDGPPKEGEVVNLSDLVIAAIDFTETSKTTASLDLKEDYTYSAPEYSNS